MVLASMARNYLWIFFWPYFDSKWAVLGRVHNLTVQINVDLD